MNEPRNQQKITRRSRNRKLYSRYRDSLEETSNRQLINLAYERIFIELTSNWDMQLITFYML